jgi:hypothetical protein
MANINITQRDESFRAPDITLNSSHQVGLQIWLGPSQNQFHHLNLIYIYLFRTQIGQLELELEFTFLSLEEVERNTSPLCHT